MRPSINHSRTEDYNALIEQMKAENIAYQELNEQPDLFSVLV
jgi:hypothetical protein